MDFKLVSDYAPMGDQPEAIAQLVGSIRHGSKHNTLLGVTGSGKTFTVANVIAQLNRPTLVLSHNKTLAAQLYGEFRNFFPENAVEYFVSYYDYYQPEAYLPSTDTFIEKDLSINAEIEKLRLRTVATLLSGRRDVIVVSSVSCLYGAGNPADFHATAINIRVGQVVSYKHFLYKLVEALYTRTERDLEPATFRVNGDTVDIMAAFGEFGSQCFRVMFYDNEVEAIQTIDPATGQRIHSLDNLTLYPTSLFVTTKERINCAVQQIYLDLGRQIEFFERAGRTTEAQRIKQRVEYDVEMIKELGYCPGIENYSRYFDGRAEGTRPFCLIDYFPKDYMLVVDESHVTLPQVHAMYGGDRARKENLVEYGFRLPAAKDNRPVTFAEFEQLQGTSIYVSATPADYELMKSEGVIVEQLIRPTGLVDPPLEVRVTANQIDDLLEEIDKRVKDDDKVLVTTITKRMAEELSKYFDRVGVRNRYIHSDVDTLERIQILEDLRAGMFDVLVGVNLLREGLDLPEVALVAILDADKEGFLRNVRSLTQIAGRAARHSQGNVILYADTCTDSMRFAIEQSNRRREKQVRYNMEHGVLPRRAQKSGTGQSTLLAGRTDENAGNTPVAYPIAEDHYAPAAADVARAYTAGGRRPRHAHRQGARGHGTGCQIAGFPRRGEIPRPHVRIAEVTRGEPEIACRRLSRRIRSESRNMPRTGNRVLRFRPLPPLSLLRGGVAEGEVLGREKTIYGGDAGGQHLRRRGPDRADLDEEFQKDVVHADRPGDRKGVAEELRPLRNRRAAERHVAVQPEPGEEGDRKGAEHRRDMGRNGHESQVEQLLIEQKIVYQKVTPPSEEDVPAAAGGIAEHLPGQERRYGRDVEQVDRPDDPLRDAHQRAV